jgi:hypothetical protein
MKTNMSLLKIRDVYEQMFSAVDISPGYGTEENVVFFSHEENVEDISVPRSDVLNNPACEEEVVADTDQEHPIFDEYPIEDDEEHKFPMGPIYDDYDSDPWESHEEEKEQQKGQFISCPEPISEKPSPGISQPALASHPPVLTRDTQCCVSKLCSREDFPL